MSHRNGFSLVEITMSVLLLSFLIAGLGGLVVRTQQQYNQSLQATRMSESLRTAETAIGTILRLAGADPLDTGNAGFFPDYRGNGKFNNFRAVSDFNPADGSFTSLFEDVSVYVGGDTLYIKWAGDMTAQPVATPIHEMLLEYYDANGVLITNGANVVDAVSVKVALVTTGITAAENHRSESWVFLRNN